jgi:SAM-dependent methyltransferase
MTFDANYQNEQSHSPTFQSHLEQVLSIIDRHFQGRKLVEIGCGKGYFMQLLRDRGFEVSGVDPAYEGEDDQVIRAKIGPDLPLRGDGLILRHVLEYFEDPLELLQLLASIGGTKGRIYIETPNFDYICRARAWFNLYYEYVFYFAPNDLNRLFSGVCESGTLFGDQYAYVVADLATLRKPSSGTSPERRKPIGDDFFEELRSIGKDRPSERKQAIWGASAKGVMFAHFMKQIGNPLHIAIDINPAKQGGYLPGSCLRVYSPKDAFKLLAPNDVIYIINSLYADEIIRMSDNRYNYVRM